MSLDRDELKPCAGCGRPVDGDTCGPACNELADERRRERDLTTTAQTYKARQAARKAQMAAILGPK